MIRGSRIQCGSFPGAFVFAGICDAQLCYILFDTSDANRKKVIIVIGLASVSVVGPLLQRGPRILDMLSEEYQDN